MSLSLLIVENGKTNQLQNYYIIFVLSLYGASPTACSNDVS